MKKQFTCNLDLYQQYFDFLSDLLELKEKPICIYSAFTDNSPFLIDEQANILYINQDINVDALTLVRFSNEIYALNLIRNTMPRLIALGSDKEKENLLANMYLEALAFAKYITERMFRFGMSIPQDILSREDEDYVERELSTMPDSYPTYLLKNSIRKSHLDVETIRNIISEEFDCEATA